MKITKIASQIMLETFSMFLFANAEESRRFEGVYAGITAGGDFGGTKANTLASARNLSISSNSNISASGVSGGIFAGYGKMVSGVYLGGEVAGELYTANGKASSISANGSTNSSITSLKKTNSFSVAGRVGKQIGEKTSIYAKGGVIFPNYRLTSSLNLVEGGATQASASATQNKRLVQLILGVGAEHVLGKISPNIELRGGVEYEHTFARKINLTPNSSTFSRANTEFNLSADAIKVRLIFKF